jgi:hypothetical protein
MDGVVARIPGIEPLIAALTVRSAGASASRKIPSVSDESEATIIGVMPRIEFYLDVGSPSGAQIYLERRAAGAVSQGGEFPMDWCSRSHVPSLAQFEEQSKNLLAATGAVAGDSHRREQALPILQNEGD